MMPLAASYNYYYGATKQNEVTTAKFDTFMVVSGEIRRRAHGRARAVVTGGDYKHAGSRREGS